MSMSTFSEVADFGALLSLGNKGNSAVWVNAQPGKANLFVGQTGMKQAFYVRPMKDLSSPTSKFEINLRVLDEPAFDEAGKKLDAFILKSVFARKEELLGKKAQYILNEDALYPLYAAGRFIKEGKASPDGTPYASTIKLQVVGKWASYVESSVEKTVTMRGTPRSIIDRCRWKPRTEALEANETRFYLWQRKNERGQDVYTEKIAMGEGEPARLVGPQDCLPGCEVTPIFAFSCIYMSEGFGTSAVAKALYITPRASVMSGGSGAGDATPDMLPSFAVLDSAPGASSAGAGSSNADDSSML